MLGSGLSCPDSTEQIAVPTQNGVRLDDDQSLPPQAQLAGQEDDGSAVAPEELGMLDLPLEHAQLLTEEGVFEDQFCLGAGDIEDSIECEGMVVRLGPLAKRPFDGLPKRTNASWDTGKEIHGYLSDGR